MPQAERSGVKIDYEVVGSGPEVVLINGMGRDRNSWVMQKHALSEKCKLLLYDHRGCGKSDRPDDGYNIPDLVEDLKAVIDAAGFDKPTLMGLSMGGMIAQYFAVTYPDKVKSLVLISTAAGKTGLRNLTEVFEEYVNNMPNLTPEESIRNGLKLILTPEFIENNQETIDALIPGFIENSATPEVYNKLLPNLKDFSVYDKLKSINVPTLIMTGDIDAIIDYENTKALTAAIPGAKEIVYAGAGHGLTLERATELNAEAIRFLTN
jgi:pimeloyl-ACP methyl ester carboxylesterase